MTNPPSDKTNAERKRAAMVAAAERQPVTADVAAGLIYELSREISELKAKLAVAEKALEVYAHPCVETKQDRCIYEKPGCCKTARKALKKLGREVK